MRLVAVRASTQPHLASEYPDKNGLRRRNLVRKEVTNGAAKRIVIMKQLKGVDRTKANKLFDTARKARKLPALPGQYPTYFEFKEVRGAQTRSVLVRKVVTPPTVAAYRRGCSGKRDR